MIFECDNKIYCFSMKIILFYLIAGFFIIYLIDSYISKSYGNYLFMKEYSIYIGVVFLIVNSFILYVYFIKIKKSIKKIVQKQESINKITAERLLPYESALDNSVDAIHWLTMEGKFIYANDSTCRQDGYSKKEFKNLYLEDIDPNFTRETAPLCMQEIKNTPNWRIESIHRRKNGTVYPVEVSGHSVKLNGKDIICAFARDMTKINEYKINLNKINNELKKSILEKEMLLKEIHHRVKNNMEIISSLLNMQARRTDNEKVRYTLMESVSRIQTMALVHEFLYLGKSFAKINFLRYTSRLLNDIKELYLSQNTKLTFDLNVDELYFSTDKCIQIGMVLHEITVNSMKYAFQENKNNLLCVHVKNDAGMIKIKIRDNGDGVEDINNLHRSNSIGMQLIHTIVENQLNGKVHFVNKNGLECNIEFLKEDADYE